MPEEALGALHPVGVLLPLLRTLVGILLPTTASPLQGKLSS